MSGGERDDQRTGSDEDPWLLSTDQRRPWLRAYLGNGRLAAQLVADGGLAGTHGAPLHVMAELYDRAPGQEVEHPVPLPGWSAIRLSVGDVLLDPDAAAGYSQELDLRRGLARTHFRWSLANGEVDVTSLQAVLRHEPHMAVIHLTIRAAMPCALAVVAALEPHPERPALESIGMVENAETLCLSGVTHEGKLPVSVAGALLVEDGEVVPGRAGVGLVRLALEPGCPREITWLVAAYSGLTMPPPEINADADVRRGKALGFKRLLAGHVAAWATLWQADIQVEGDVEVQLFARAGLFSLLCSLRAEVPASIAPMGLSSLGYNGHIFWDADTWMFPPLLLLHPDIGRSMLTYRQDRLPAARVRARAEGYAGAMFPWESAGNGDETTPISIANTGLKEHHITACVALAQWQYYLASGDRDWLAERAWPLIEAAAQFWLSRVTHGPRGYEIHGVIAADEYAEDVDNDAFTNGAARAALLAAIEAAGELGRPAPSAWRDVADGLILARDGDLVLEFDGYDGRMIKQGDVELLTFPLEHPLSEACIARNLETYWRVTDPDGPAMGRGISAVVAAQLGRREEARRLFTASYQPHLWGPFYSLAETRGNGAVNFLTGVGGALQTLLFGFAGIRMHRRALAVDPLLPAGWHALRFPALHWRGQVFSLSVCEGDELELTPKDAAVPVTLMLRRWRPGAEPLLVRVRAATAVRCTLEASDWRILPGADDHTWRIQPPVGDRFPSFMALRLTATTSNAWYVLEIEQRVRNGDD